MIGRKPDWLPVLGMLGSRRLPPELDLEAAVWRGSDLGRFGRTDRTKRHAQFDALLPGGGWPTRSLVELLQPQPALIEWRLLVPTPAERLWTSEQLVEWWDRLEFGGN